MTKCRRRNFLRDTIASYAEAGRSHFAALLGLAHLGYTFEQAVYALRTYKPRKPSHD